MSSLPSKKHAYIGAGSPTANNITPLLGTRPVKGRRGTEDSDPGLFPAPKLDWDRSVPSSPTEASSVPFSPRLRRIIQSPGMQSPSKLSSNMERSLLNMAYVPSPLRKRPRSISQQAFKTPHLASPWSTPKSSRNPNVMPPAPNLGAKQDGLSSQTSFQRNEQGVSLGKATFNGINLLLGVGALSLPFAFSQAGWLIAGSLLFVMSCITCHTGKLIGCIMELSPNLRSFTDIGFAAMGPWGSRAVSVVFFIELFSAAGMYVILCGDSLEALGIPLEKTTLYLLGAAVMITTLLLKDLSAIAKLSVVGVASSVVLIGVVVGVGMVQPAGEGSWKHPEKTESFTSGRRSLLSIGLVMVGFAGHACFPTLRTSMKSLEDYNKMVNASYLACVLLYGTVAVLGYLMYGIKTKQEITQNMQISWQAQGQYSGVWWAVQASILLMVINPITKFALTLNPVSVMVEEFVFVNRCGRGKAAKALDADFDSPLLNSSSDSHSDGGGGGGGGMGTGGAPSNASYLAVVGTRVVIGALAAGFAMVIPGFAQLVSFIGAFCSCLVSIVFPALAYLLLFWDDISCWSKLLNGSIVVFGLICSVVGTVAVFINP